MKRALQALFLCAWGCAPEGAKGTSDPPDADPKDLPPPSPDGPWDGPAEAPPTDSPDAAVDAPSPFGCAGPSDCRDPALPVCAAGRCVECAEDARCGPSDHCDRAAGRCAPGCHRDEGCAPPTPRCDTTVHTCVECSGGRDCPAGYACGGGRCAQVTCPAGRADCNGLATDGCEADLARNPAHCGACGRVGRETCDAADDDCDGVCDNLDGCRVGVHRSNGVEHFYTTDLTEAGCCGFTVEAQNYFYLYRSMVPGTMPLLRCYNARARHLMTTRPDCEGARREGVLGYIATSRVCGAVPLYRMSHPSGDNFYTTSEAERDSAAMRYGYTALELAGYVWTAPRGR